MAWPTRARMVGRSQTEVVIVCIEVEARDLLLAVQHHTISREDLVRRLEDIECRAPADFACQFTKAVTWAEHGQISRLIDQLEAIVGDPRFSTRH
jgi:hypothetical protein